MDQFVDAYINDKIGYNPYWTHVIDFYRMRFEENIFFVTYEEMIRDLPDVIKRLSRFLACKDLTDSEMEKIVNHLKFKNIKGLCCPSKFFLPILMRFSFQKASLETTPTSLKVSKKLRSILSKFPIYLVIWV